MYDSELDGRLRELFEMTFPRDLTPNNDISRESEGPLNEERFI
jgi:hypothetical protein